MIKQTVGQLLKNHVVLAIKGIDRMYSDLLYQPRLQTGGGVAIQGSRIITH
uniref:Uncharacterized protein n=1 Tax=Candidatus Kentrum sp. DK TaxID=2126562 RepID=A0A450TFY5_9GAMM|nr:MAG: hypothetical protein BECKDK2373C_GA0170839_11418 [Candidatus Kentron sp. DK]